MFCPNCGTNVNVPSDASQSFCPNCGAKIVANQQPENPVAPVNRARDVIAKQLKTPLFLTVAICLTVVLAFQAVSMLAGGIGGILGGALTFVFMLLSVIGMWQAYSQKPGADLAKAVKNASYYDAFQNVMYIICIVLLGILAAILLLVFVLLLVAGGSDGSEAGEVVAAASGIASIGALIAFIICAIGIVVVVLIRGVFAKRRAYFCELSNAAYTGMYKAKKAPVVGSYIIGGYFALSGLSSMFSSALASVVAQSILDEMAELLKENQGFMGDAEKELISGIQDLLYTISDGAALNAIMSNLSTLVLGAFFIVSAIWMSKVHDAQMLSQRQQSVY